MYSSFSTRFYISRETPCTRIRKNVYLFPLAKIFSSVTNNSLSIFYTFSSSTCVKERRKTRNPEDETTRRSGDGIRDPTRGEMRVISINVERSHLRKHRGVNANYSERSARIPDSIIERANGAACLWNGLSKVRLEVATVQKQSKMARIDVC